MKIKSYIAAGVLAAGVLMSCQDSVSDIGGSIVSGEVTITADSIVMPIESECVYNENFDGRNVTKLLGRINVPEYGRLTCSFVSQMMSSSQMNIPDSITVDDIDSLRLILSVPRGRLTGDSLAPQQLRVYRLNRQLPSDISSTFNPEGYYDPSQPMGVKSYTLSNIAKGDSTLKNDLFVRIPVQMPMSLARDVFERYRNNDPIFQWPETFNTYFPGIYVQQNFGNGCIANITKAEMYTYWKYTRTRRVMQADSTYVNETYTVRDSVCLMAYQPEVIASNVIDFQISDYIKGLVAAGGQVITTPGGYTVNIHFPVQRLLDEYHSKGSELAVVTSLGFEIPAEAISNDYGLTAAPNLLMIKKSEYEAFFAENKIPDGISSFYAAYNTETESYQFNSMRAYFMKVLEAEKKGEQLGPEESEFVLVPVSVQTENVENYDGTVTTYVTRCQSYMERPTMTHLHTDRALIKFTYSNQIID